MLHWIFIMQQKITIFLLMVITFVINVSTQYVALCSKKAGDTIVTSRRAHKVPLSSLEPSFIKWLMASLW